GYLPQLAPDTLTGSASYVTNTEYDAEGRVTTRELGNGLTSAYEYYAWEEGENEPGYQQGGRLHALVTAIGETTYQDLSYHYDPGGNILQIDNQVIPETILYTYDQIDRLTSDTLNGGSTYAYDNEGNLTQKGISTLSY